VSLAWLPNAICVVRILLVAPCALALLAGRYDLTLLLFGVAAISDGLDGWLAKTFNWTSRLGKILDPIADKLLLVTVFVTLVWTGLVPLWLGVTVVARDVLIVGGAIAYLLQLSFVLAVIADAGWHNMPRGLVVAVGAATFGTTVVSGIDYVLTYAREALRAGRAAARAAP